MIEESKRKLVDLLFELSEVRPRNIIHKNVADVSISLLEGGRTVLLNHLYHLTELFLGEVFHLLTHSHLIGVRYLLGFIELQEDVSLQGFEIGVLLPVRFDAWEVIPHQFTGGLFEFDCNLVDGRLVSIVQLAVIPNELEVVKSLLHSGVLAGLQIAEAGTEIHGPSDNDRVVIQPISPVVNRFQELSGVFPLHQLVDDDTTLAVVLLVHLGHLVGAAHCNIIWTSNF